MDGPGRQANDIERSVEIASSLASGDGALSPLPRSTPSTFTP
jgi:hypothetical protein